MKDINCCLIYTDREQERCMLCGAYSSSNEDIKSMVEYIKIKGDLNENRTSRS
ncbi:hypothetical protein HXW73_16810 [Halomonas sp. SH5A2]|uniref:hypothetical protein n=1 Tax=Halomonas sp. SH5A2 TaxID=2749040 RepID=UPI00163E7465|nr:hypothetical protein [Halomonas sp. SH5A2]QNI04466.1 hypothetical protein HXW73_16810 [Halomonas sp. SH5A2]